RGFNLQGERQEGRALEEEEGHGKAVAATTSTPSTLVAPVGKSKGKGRNGSSQRSRENDVCIHCCEKGHWKREYPQLLSIPGIGKKQKAKLRQDDPKLGDDKVVAVVSMGSLNL
ncbi:UNVERIFIED_CONTAM: hypothetical protein Sindi_1843300, partial [Sesamum indicum]